MRIAILGAGYTGLALAWHLLEKHSFSKRHSTDIQVVIFDSIGIGGGASGIAAGLMHCYAGAHAKLNWQGVAGMQATIKLLEVASQELGYSVADFSGLLRPVVTEEQKNDFARCASLYPDVRWLDAQCCQAMVPELSAYPGIFIDSAVTVRSDCYLKGLWNACQKRGATLQVRTIQSLSEVSDFDLSVVALGAAATSLPELAHLAVRPIKGQILQLNWPFSNVPFPVNSHAYLILNPNQKSCLAGATFERNFTDASPQLEVAIADIFPKISALFPSLQKSAITGCRAGLRASTPNHLPLMAQINPKCWVLTGMGSKGLLYHALFAEKLAGEILSS